MQYILVVTKFRETSTLYSQDVKLRLDGGHLPPLVPPVGLWAVRVTAFGEKVRGPV